MKRNFTLVFSLLVTLVAFNAHALTSISGYYDFTMAKTKNLPMSYRQQHMNLMMQHEVENYKFFSELEFEDATDFDFGGNYVDVTAQTNGKGTRVRGRLYLERAWAEVVFSQYLTLRMGQMLHGSLYYQNHYPSIAVYTGELMTTQTIFARNVLGVRAYGDLGAGFGYQLWSHKANNDAPDTEEANGAKLSWSGEMGNMLVMLGAQMGKYNMKNGKTDQTAVGAELTIDVSNFSLWFEFGTRKADNSEKFGTGAKKDVAKATAMDIMLSYSIDMGETGEVVPFVMFGNMTGSGLHQEDVTAGDNYYTKNSQVLFGVNYRPTPTITWKFQYKTIAAPEGYGAASATSTSAVLKDSTTNKDLSDSEISLTFVYFYN